YRRIERGGPGGADFGDARRAAQPRRGLPASRGPRAVERRDRQRHGRDRRLQDRSSAGASRRDLLTAAVAHGLAASASSSGMTMSSWDPPPDVHVIEKVPFSTAMRSRIVITVSCAAWVSSTEN